MKLSNFVTSLFLALGLAFTAQAQWIKLPLPGTPRTRDGKPNLSAPSPRASDGHPDLSGLWISRRQYTNPKGRGLERFMPDGSKAPMLPAAEKFYAEITAHGDAADPSERCLPDGIPNHMLPIPIKIVQTPGLILTMLKNSPSSVKFSRMAGNCRLTPHRPGSVTRSRIGIRTISSSKVPASMKRPTWTEKDYRTRKTCASPNATVGPTSATS